MRLETAQHTASTHVTRVVSPLPRLLFALLATTRWPDRETVADRSQGAQLAVLRELVQYWGSGSSTTRPTGAATSRRGSTRSCSRRNCARRSNHFASS